MLHNTLVALATAFSDDPRIYDLTSRQFFARKAKSYLEDECQNPNISVVHALSILATFHSSLGEVTLGYMYFGTCLIPRDTELRELTFSLNEGMSGRISQVCKCIPKTTWYGCQLNICGWQWD
jgi:hypothetical protein